MLRATRGVACALAASGVFLATFSACRKGLQELPAAYPLWKPEAAGSPGLSCTPGAASRAARSHPEDARFAYLGAGKNWLTDGAAFAALQPVLAPAIPASYVSPRWTDAQRHDLPKGALENALVPLGGDYWAPTSYPIVAAAEGPWISSRYATIEPSRVRDRGESITGSMWVPLRLDRSFLRIAIGGDSDERVGVELLVEPGAATAAASCPGGRDDRAFRLPPPPGYEGYVRALVWHAADQEAVRTIDVRTDGPGCSLRGARAVLRVFDASPDRHVNVGRIALADAPPAPAFPPPVWGFADYHAHPTDYLGFGGLQDDPILWGVPGGAVSEYVGDTDAARSRIGRDIPPCDADYGSFNAHQGGFAAPVMINATEGRTSENIGDLSHPALAEVHPPHGAPTFQDFPGFRRGAHMQYHVTQIHRAYLGGLRLMTALAVHNRGLEYGTGWVTCGAAGAPTVETTPDWRVIRNHSGYSGFGGSALVCNDFST